MARHVPHLYVPGPWESPTLPLGDDHRHHLERVLRLDVGSAVAYTDGAGSVGTGELGNGSIERGAESAVDRSSELWMAVAPTKANERNRFMVEKLAELGAKRLTWLTTEFGQGRAPRPEKADAWAVGALEQSRGAWLIDIDGPVPLSALGSYQLCDRSGSAAPDPNTVICIGPEGGWSQAELHAAADVAALPFGVLRTETASVAAAVLAITSSSGRQ